MKQQEEQTRRLSLIVIIVLFITLISNNSMILPLSTPVHALNILTPKSLNVNNNNNTTTTTSESSSSSSATTTISITSSSSITSTTVQSLFNNSQILNENDLIRVYNDILTSVNDKSQLRLLYRASQDGFSSFHSHCDDKGPTLTLVKTENGSVFGGYTPSNWKSTKTYPTYVKDDRTFIFSIYGPNGEERFTILRPSLNRPLGIWASPVNGPEFGAGPDFRVVLKKDGYHVSNMGLSFLPPHSFKGQPTQYLDGYLFFKVVDYEVYALH